MKKMLLFPGQGSQKPGMGQAMAENFEVAKRTFEEADDALGFPLSKLCFEGPADDLNLTSNSQPAILATSIASFRVLKAEHPGLVYSYAAGHSLGEWSALVAAGVLRFSDALRLVRLRGQAMQEAVPVGQGGMAAVMGLEEAEVEKLCSEAAEGEICAPANFNGGGQIVISGHASAIGRAVELAKGRKARAVPLKVSAPFHCSLMAPAAERVKEALDAIEVGRFEVPVVANVDASPNESPERVKGLLVDQVTGAVRWSASMEWLIGEGVGSAIEVGFGSVLKGLMKRIDKTVKVASLGTPEDVAALEVE
jgi:[acyl-carrier-protein] S-malonyltransferase